MDLMDILDSAMDLSAMDLDDDRPERPAKIRKSHYAKHRAVTKDDTRGYEADRCAMADTLSKQFTSGPGAVRDLIWHFIAANIQPTRYIVRFCDPGADMTGGPEIFGILPDVKGSDKKGESSDGVDIKGPVPAAPLSQIQADFASLNGQGRELVLQRLRDVGHNPVDLGLVRVAGKSKARKAA